MYRDFAYIYDELMDDVDYKKWYLYIEDIIKDEKPDVRDILEMACGTGRMSYYFLEKGYNMTCFDLSEDMLAVAENRLRKFKNKQILKHNMIDFSNRDSYDLVISNCDSINYIVGDGDLLETFQNVRDNLRDGGIFIFDINSSYKLKNILGNNTYIEDRDNVFYSWENFLYEDEHLVEFFLSFFIKEEDNRYRRFNEEHVERIYEITEIETLLKESGFTKIEYYETFKFEKPNDKSERITFVASL